jgi:hypothetical protein
MRFRIFRSAEDKQLFKLRLAVAAIGLMVVAFYVAVFVVSVYAREGTPGSLPRLPPN